MNAHAQLPYPYYDIVDPKGGSAATCLSGSKGDACSVEVRDNDWQVEGRHMLWELNAPKEKLRRLYGYTEDWDGLGSPPPDPTAVDKARGCLEQFWRQVRRLRGTWIPPHISASDKGEVLLSWSRGNKALDLYISATEITYLKSWGTHILDDMEDGSLAPDAPDLQPLWRWFAE